MVVYYSHVIELALLQTDCDSGSDEARRERLRKHLGIVKKRVCKILYIVTSLLILYYMCMMCCLNQYTVLNFVITWDWPCM